jgi:hypothetical protein
MVEWARREVVQTPEFVVRMAVRSLNDADTRGSLAQIKVHALVIVGDQDRITPPRESEILTKGISNSSLAIIPAVGHFSMLERPAAFDRILRSFLDAPSRAAPREWQTKLAGAYVASRPRSTAPEFREIGGTARKCGVIPRVISPSAGPWQVGEGDRWLSPARPCCAISGRSFASGFIFTTALPPAVAAGGRRSLSHPTSPPSGSWRFG